MRRRLRSFCLRDLDRNPSGEAASEPGMATTMASGTDLRQLGNSDLHLTSIGFGAWAIGGGNWEFGWGAQEDDDSVRTSGRWTSG